ncbi:MAG: HlyD family type I secretion periplasmic adaptor subunit [Desulfovibrionaceae bacterium]|nr:HlyD family type I secretion periplasmic adaptor subunit [Desulfovibrionaceae bacterium]
MKLAVPAGVLGEDEPEESGSGFWSFIKSLVFKSQHEQKSGVDPLQAAREYLADRATEPSKAAAAGLPALSQSKSEVVPGLFAAMDAPLEGLMPDDIQYANEVDAALARRPRLGARVLSICVALLFLILLIWAAFASLDEVTHADGSVVGSQRTQTIQNLEGGILRSILVHEGQIVEKGMVLAQLDNELAESSYRDAINKTIENTLEIMRLEAELQDVEPKFPQDLNLWVAKIIGHYPDKRTLERAKQIVLDQTNAWTSRKEQLKADIEVLKAQYEQKIHEVNEQSARKTQLDKSLVLAVKQRDTALNLVRHNNFSRMEFIGLEQKVVDLQGQVDQLASSIPKAQAAAAESQQRIASRVAEQQADISTSINKRRLELNSLHETLAAGGDRVTRTELRSPVRGTIKQIYIHSVGGVVKPGESIMDVVPLDDTLLVEAKVTPRDVAFLRPGQDAIIKVSAYDFNIYGGLDGKLESISADTIEDKRGDYFYIVKIRTPETNIVYHNEVLPIIPGMLVTADILIGKKTVLDYLLKPILKAKQNALRER